MTNLELKEVIKSKLDEQHEKYESSSGELKQLHIKLYNLYLTMFRALCQIDSGIKEYENMDINAHNKG